MSLAAELVPDGDADADAAVRILSPDPDGDADAGAAVRILFPCPIFTRKLLPEIRSQPGFELMALECERDQAVDEFGIFHS